MTPPVSHRLWARGERERMIYSVYTQCIEKVKEASLYTHYRENDFTTQTCKHTDVTFELPRNLCTWTNPNSGVGDYISSVAYAVDS